MSQNPHRHPPHTGCPCPVRAGVTPRWLSDPSAVSQPPPEPQTLSLPHLVPTHMGSAGSSPGRVFGHCQLRKSPLPGSGGAFPRGRARGRACLPTCHLWWPQTWPCLCSSPAWPGRRKKQPLSRPMNTESKSGLHRDGPCIPSRSKKIPVLKTFPGVVFSLRDFSPVKKQEKTSLATNPRGWEPQPPMHGVQEGTQNSREAELSSGRGRTRRAASPGGSWGHHSPGWAPPPSPAARNTQQHPRKSSHSLVPSQGSFSICLPPGSRGAFPAPESLPNSLPGAESSSTRGGLENAQGSVGNKPLPQIPTGELGSGGMQVWGGLSTPWRGAGGGWGDKGTHCHV